MARMPRFAKAFVGRWHIVEMDVVWDSDFLGCGVIFRCERSGDRERGAGGAGG